MANQKIRQEINLINREIAGVTGEQGERIYLDTDDYNGATYYFEFIAKNSHTLNHFITLYHVGEGTFETFVYCPESTTSYARYRTSSFTPNNSYPTKYIDITSTYLSIQAVRIVILQDAAAITDTSTQIEIGSYQVISNDTTYAPLTYPKYWYYDSAKWDGSVTFDFHVSTINSDSKGDLYIQLQYSSDFTTWTAVTGSSITTTSETAIITRATGLTLTDKRWYRIAAYLESTMYGATIYNAKVVVNQTDATQITKCQPEYLLINRGNLAAGANRDFDTLYDHAEWDEGGGTLNFIHAQDCSDDASSVKLQDMSGPTDLEGSELLGDTDTTNQQSMSVYPTGKDLDVTLYYWTLYNSATYEGAANSFVATGGYCIGAGIRIKKEGTPGTATIGLYAVDGSNFPTGSSLASVSITASDVSTSTDWRFFYFDTPYETTDGTTYAIAIIHDAGSLGNTYVVSAYTTGRGTGSTTNNAGSSWSGDTKEACFMPLEAIDMPASAQTIDSYIVAV